MEYGITLVSRVVDTTAPVTLAEAKVHLRVDGTDEDAGIQAYLDAAIEAVEDAQSRVLQQATMRMVLPGWPANGVFVIPRYPVVSVESITYLEAGESTPTTLSSSLYRLEADLLPPRVAIKKDQYLPTASLESGFPVTVNFTAGYADGSVPEKPRHAIKLLLGSWYENREGVVTGTIATRIPDAYHSLIMADRLW